MVNLKSEDFDSRRLAKYDFSKHNITENIGPQQVENEIIEKQNQLFQLVVDYENVARRLESLVEIPNTHTMEPEKSEDVVSLE